MGPVASETHKKKTELGFFERIASQDKTHYSAKFWPSKYQLFQDHQSKEESHKPRVTTCTLIFRFSQNTWRWLPTFGSLIPYLTILPMNNDRFNFLFTLNMFFLMSFWFCRHAVLAKSNHPYSYSRCVQHRVNAFKSKHQKW